ncbi:zinc finger domain-containing protein [Amycolatopsis samaneae]|uniref:DNA-binding phage zinc finger domain-containing protein n=1 Tax=Amycolatopsis samaneae TaxID=664691 RepID=A0ABW5GCJ9_9PSEU
MSTIYAVMSRSDVRGLLMRHTDAHVTDELVTAWLAGLAGYSLAECHAALTAMGTTARRATPSDVAGSCDAARDRPAGHSASAAIPPQQRRPSTSSTATTRREYHRQAGLRGIRNAYAAMGWERNPDHDLARSVPCPFCKAKAEVVCGPLSRNRAGHKEKRDPVTRMHPSRLERARQTTSTPHAHKEIAR